MAVLIYVLIRFDIVAAVVVVVVVVAVVVVVTAVRVVIKDNANYVFRITLNICFNAIYAFHYAFTFFDIVFISGSSSIGSNQHRRN